MTEKERIRNIVAAAKLLNVDPVELARAVGKIDERAAVRRLARVMSSA